jgi:hypothetical protein
VSTDLSTGPGGALTPEQASQLAAALIEAADEIKALNR